MFRVFRTPGGLVGTLDGWGAVRGENLSELVSQARALAERILNGAFPDRPGIDPLDAIDVVRLVIEIRPRRTAPRRPESRPTMVPPDRGV